MKNKIMSLAFVLAFGPISGCALGPTAQIKGKVPRINAEVYNASISTIYGAAGTLREEGVVWNGDVKTVKKSDLKVTTPVGTFEEHVENATFGATQQPAASK